MDCEEIPYVSCIRIGKRPILPPVMTDERRSEMRYYRDMAVNLEKRRKAKRHSIDSGVMMSSSDGSLPKKAETTESNDIYESSTSAANSSPEKVGGWQTMNDKFNESTTNTDESTKIDTQEVVPKEKCDINEPLPNIAVSSEEFNISQLVSKEQCDIHKARTNTGDSLPVVDNWQIVYHERRSSYTLETPSPVMLEYMQAHKRYDELLIDMVDSSETSTVVNEEIFTSVPARGIDNNIFVQGRKLTLQDLEGMHSPSTKSELWNFNDYSFGCKDIKQFVKEVKNTKAVSLPNTCQSSPILPIRTSVSSHCLNNVSPDETTCTNYDNSICIELPETEKNFESKEDRLYINDSFRKYAELLDLGQSLNMSFESESVYSDCSSVSLNKFLVDMKITECQDTALNNYLQMKEQLELKHRNELIKLLREQQKENNWLDQFIRVSNTSSPKSSYLYSKDVVLKKYSAESSPSPVFSKSPAIGDTTQRSSRAPSCRRRICEDEPKKPNATAYNLPLMSVANFTNNRNIEDFETRVRAATIINAAVRGYFVRRLFKTARIRLLLQTVNDCLVTAISLQKENNLKPEELSLQSRVLQQSITAQNEILSTFALPIQKQLEIISMDRDQKNRSSLRKTKTPLPLSEATQKTIERRKSLNVVSRSEKKIVRERCKSASSLGADSSKCKSTPITSKLKTKLSHSYSVPRYTRRSWR